MERPSRLLDCAGRQGNHVAEMQRRRLLLAFVEVVVEGGLENAGVARVCARAGVSRRTFYDLFGDREACFAAAFDAAFERLASSVLPAYARERRWRDAMRAGLAVLLEALDRDPALGRMLLLETLKGASPVLDRRRRAIDVLTAAIDRGRIEARQGTQPGPLIAECAVGGALAVICARVLESDGGSLAELLNPLMSMIVQPYLGAAAARRELERKAHTSAAVSRRRRDDSAGRAPVREPFKDLPIRITFRTARVLAAIALHPGASNRDIGDLAGVADQGQMSKLLSRLEACGLAENSSQGHEKGEPNAWRLTERGEAVRRTIELP